MQNVIADLAVESEAATALGMRLAAAVDDAADPHEAALRRIALPLAKYWVCKRTPMMVAEALECLGGNGYVEESGMPLLFRESPLNSVWEGSGNVNALDVLRALSREPEALNAWIVEVGRARGEDPHLDRAIDVGARVAGRHLRAGGRRPPAGRPDGRLPAGRPAACSTRPPRSPTRSAPPGSARSTAARSARSPAAPTSRASSPAPPPSPDRPPGDSGAPNPAHPATLARRTRPTRRLWRGARRRDAPGRHPSPARRAGSAPHRPPDAPGQRGWAERWEAGTANEANAAAATAPATSATR